MGTERKTEIRVGLFVFSALLVLVLIVMWGMGTNFFTRRIWISVRFDDVHGLKKGDPVVIRGIQQGEVDGIVLLPEYAEIRIWIRKEVPLFSDLNISLENRELMGGKQISISPGRSLILFDPSQVLTGERKSDIFDILERTEEIVSHADSIFNQINVFIGKDRFSRVLGNIEKTTNQARVMLSENRGSFRSVIKNLDETTRRLSEDSTFFRLGKTVEYLDSTILLFHQFAGMIRSKEGSLGQFVQNKRLYDCLLQTTVDLDSLVRDVKSNPKKYIHVSVF